MADPDSWTVSVMNVLSKISSTSLDFRRTVLIESISSIYHRLTRAHKSFKPVDIANCNDLELQVEYVRILKHYCSKIDDADTFDYMKRIIEAHPLLEEGDRLMLFYLLYGRPPFTFKSLVSRINPYVDGLVLPENTMIINTMLNIVYKYRKPEIIEDALRFVRTYIHDKVISMPGRNMTEKIKLYVEFAKTLMAFTNMVPLSTTAYKLYFYIDVGTPISKLPFLQKIDPATWVDRAGRFADSATQFVIDPRTKNLMNKLSYTYAPGKDTFDQALVASIRDSPDKTFSEQLLKTVVEHMTYTFTYATTAAHLQEFSKPYDPMFEICVEFPVGATLLPLTLQGKGAHHVFMIPPGYRYDVMSTKGRTVNLKASAKRKTMPAIENFLA